MRYVNLTGHRIEHVGAVAEVLRNLQPPPSVRIRRNTSWMRVHIKGLRPGKPGREYLDKVRATIRYFVAEGTKNRQYPACLDGESYPFEGRAEWNG